MEDYFKYKYSDKIEFSINESSHVSIIGNSNDLFVDSFLSFNKECNIFIGKKKLLENNLGTIYKSVSVVLFKHLNIFVAETVMDEIAFGLEGLAYNKDDIRELIISKSKEYKLNNLLNRDPNSLGSSDKAKMKILCALIWSTRKGSLSEL